MNNKTVGTVGQDVVNHTATHTEQPAATERQHSQTATQPVAGKRLTNPDKPKTVVPIIVLTIIIVLVLASLSVLAYIKS